MTPSLALHGPVSARAVRFYRIAAALLAGAWFLRVWFDADHYAATDGLLDHALAERIFWFTWQPLFRPGMPAFWPTAVFALAVALCVAVALDRARRLAAGLLYLLAVCTYRWNFMVMYVDDVVVHLMLFWLLCLPDTRDAAGAPLDAVPGTVVRLAALNVTLLYLIAGLTKWRSPMWLDGSAAWAALRQPIAFHPEWMGEAPRALERAFTYATLVLEPLVALAPWVRAGSVPRRVLLAAALALHLGIALTLDVVFANLGCAALLALACHDEFGRVTAGPRPGAPEAPRWPAGAKVAALGLMVIAGSTVCSALQPQWRQPPPERAGQPEHFATAEAGSPTQTVLSGAAWALGLAQQYRLFDWIDERDGYIAAQEVLATDPDGASLCAPPLLPHTLRGALLRAYLSGVTWAPLPPPALRAWQTALGARIAEQACRHTPDALRREVTTIRRSGHPDAPPVTTALSFRCRSGRVEVLETRFADPTGGLH